MNIQPVPVDLMLAAHEIGCRGRRICVINTLLAEQRHFGFEAIYAATQRLCALNDALQDGPDLDEWIMAGSPYSEISKALWEAAAAAPLVSRGDGTGPYEDHGRFDIGELRKVASARRHEN